MNIDELMSEAVRETLSRGTKTPTPAWHQDVGYAVVDLDAGWRDRLNLVGVIACAGSSLTASELLQSGSILAGDIDEVNRQLTRVGLRFAWEEIQHVIRSRIFNDPAVAAAEAPLKQQSATSPDGLPLIRMVRSRRAPEALYAQVVAETLVWINRIAAPWRLRDQDPGCDRAKAFEALLAVGNIDAAYKFFEERDAT